MGLSTFIFSLFIEPLSFVTKKHPYCFLYLAVFPYYIHNFDTLPHAFTSPGKIYVRCVFHLLIFKGRVCVSQGLTFFFSFLNRWYNTPSHAIVLSYTINFFKFLYLIWFLFWILSFFELFLKKNFWTMKFNSVSFTYLKLYRLLEQQKKKMSSLNVIYFPLTDLMLINKLFFFVIEGTRHFC